MFSATVIFMHRLLMMVMAENSFSFSLLWLLFLTRIPILCWLRTCEYYCSTFFFFFFSNNWYSTTHTCTHTLFVRCSSFCKWNHISAFLFLFMTTSLSVNVQGLTVGETATLCQCYQLLRNCIKIFSQQFFLSSCVIGNNVQWACHRDGVWRDPSTASLMEFCFEPPPQ